jgi:hypothetical protein
MLIAPIRSGAPTIRSDRTSALARRVSPLLFRWDQSFPHEMPVVVGRVVETPKLLIPQPFIKPLCLKAERVQPCRMTAALAGADFRLIHQLAPDAPAA